MVAQIEHDFQEKVSRSLRLASEGVDRYRVFTPFMFDDGDCLGIVLKREGDRWFLTDEGHTLMHLTYGVDERDLQRGTRQKILTNALSSFAVQDREGELVLPIEGDDYGDSLFSFVQALIKVTDVSYLTRERVRSTFLEDFRTLLREAVPSDRLLFDWREPDRDPQGMYAVDSRINGMKRPLFVYALSNDHRTRDATIALLQFEKNDTARRQLRSRLQRADDAAADGCPTADCRSRNWKQRRDVGVATSPARSRRWPGTAL